LYRVILEENPFGERREGGCGELHFECCQIPKKRLKIGLAFNPN